MPINKKWSAYTMDHVKENQTNHYGVYEIGNAVEVIYIGEGHVKTRLLAHFPLAPEPVVGGGLYRVAYTGGKERCVQRQNALLAEFLKANGRLPRFNERSRN